MWPEFISKQKWGNSHPCGLSISLWLCQSRGWGAPCISRRKAADSIGAWVFWGPVQFFSPHSITEYFLSPRSLETWWTCWKIHLPGALRYPARRGRKPHCFWEAWRIGVPQWPWYFLRHGVQWWWDQKEAGLCCCGLKPPLRPFIYSLGLRASEAPSRPSPPPPG